MITTGLNVLANFCKNVYPTDSLVNESWYGIQRNTLNMVLSDDLTTQNAGTFDVVSFQDAPENTELKTKYPDGLVYINIPYNMIDKVGMQKYGAHHPGKIIGYNNAKRYALVLFYSELYGDSRALLRNAQTSVNTYSYKYLSPLTEELMTAGASYTVSGLKKFLTSNSGLRFTSGRIKLEGKQLLASGTHPLQPGIFLTVKSSGTSLRRPILDNLLISLPDGFQYDRTGRILRRQLSFVTHTTSTSDILIKIQSALDSYHDIVAESMSVKAGLRLIQNASSNYPGQSLIHGDGDLFITYSPADRFTDIQDFLGEKYDPQASIDMATFRALIPTKIDNPRARSLVISIREYKDVKTSKTFLMVTTPGGNPMVLTPSSAAYTHLVEMTENQNKAVESTVKFKSAYNALTGKGKELFTKYLTHPGA